MIALISRYLYHFFSVHWLFSPNAWFSAMGLAVCNHNSLRIALTWEAAMISELFSAQSFVQCCWSWRRLPLHYYFDFTPVHCCYFFIILCYWFLLNCWNNIKYEVCRRWLMFIFLFSAFTIFDNFGPLVSIIACTFIIKSGKKFFNCQRMRYWSGLFSREGCLKMLSIKGGNSTAPVHCNTSEMWSGRCGLGVTCIDWCVSVEHFTVRVD